MLGSATAYCLATIDFDKAIRTSNERAMMTIDNRRIGIGNELQLAPLRPGELPAHVGYAVLAAESQTFYQNVGVSVRGMARAAINNARGAPVQGGSGIQQQLAKNTILAGVPRHLRKIADVPVSLAMTIKVGRNEILRAYLDNVYFGSGALGVRAAAKVCFRTTVQNLTLGQGLLLAASLPAPSRADCGRNPVVRKRARTILKAMLKLRWATQHEADRVHFPMARRFRAPAVAPSAFADAVRRLVKAPTETPVSVTLDTRVQAIVERVATSELRTVRKSIDAGIIVMRIDGGIAALYGGRRYRRDGFDRATQAALPTGSTMKVAALNAALTAGMSLDTPVLDAPYRDGWPANSDGRYLGAMSMRDAFVLSRNPPWPATVERLGFDAWKQSLRQLGLPAPARPTKAMVLGTESYTLVQIAGAFTSIAAGAGPVEGHFVARPPKDLGTLPAARALCSALRAVVTDGTGRAADSPVVEIAGKTGSTRREALFVGIAGDTVVAVRLDRSRGAIGINGGDAPARIARRILEGLAKAQLIGTHKCGEGVKSSNLPRP